MTQSRVGTQPSRNKQRGKKKTEINRTAARYQYRTVWGMKRCTLRRNPGVRGHGRKFCLRHSRGLKKVQNPAKKAIRWVKPGRRKVALSARKVGKKGQALLGNTLNTSSPGGENLRRTWGEHRSSSAIVLGVRRRQRNPNEGGGRDGKTTNASSINVPCSEIRITETTRPN